MSGAYAAYMASSSNLRYQVRSVRHKPDPQPSPDMTSGQLTGFVGGGRTATVGAQEATSHSPDLWSFLQILAGVVEERGVERLLHGNALACGVASFVVRTGNTFLGAGRP